MGLKFSNPSSEKVIVPTKFTESLMTSAKRKSIVGLMDASKIPYFKQGAGYASVYCPHCGMGSKNSNKCNISNELWKCFSCGNGGSIIDYAMMLWGLSDVESAKKLVGASITEAKLKPGEVNVEQKKDLVDLTSFYTTLKSLPRQYNAEAYDYLVKTRSIPEKIVNEAVYRGVLRFLPGSPVENAKYLIQHFGEAQLKSLGFWKEGSKMPWVSFRPLVFLLPSMKSADWRLAHTPAEGEKKSIRFGADKSFWYWKGEDSTKLSVVEGAIDMLSMVALGWKGDIKGLPGTGVWEDDWMEGYDFAAFTMDDDAAGQMAMKSMSEAATLRGIAHRAKAPPAGDVNAQLQLKRKAA